MLKEPLAASMPLDLVKKVTKLSELDLTVLDKI